MYYSRNEHFFWENKQELVDSAEETTKTRSSKNQQTRGSPAAQLRASPASWEASAAQRGLRDEASCVNALTIRMKAANANFLAFRGPRLEVFDHDDDALDAERLAVFLDKELCRAQHDVHNEMWFLTTIVVSTDCRFPSLLWVGVVLFTPAIFFSTASVTFPHKFQSNIVSKQARAPSVVGSRIWPATEVQVYVGKELVL